MEKRNLTIFDGIDRSSFGLTLTASSTWTICSLTDETIVEEFVTKIITQGEDSFFGLTQEVRQHLADLFPILNEIL